MEQLKEETKQHTSSLALIDGPDGARRKGMVQKLQKEGHDFNCKFKFIMVGGSGVGKTAAILRFCDNKFNPNLMNTIGVDFKTKFVLVGHSKIKL